MNLGTMKVPEGISAKTVQNAPTESTSVIETQSSASFLVVHEEKSRDYPPTDITTQPYVSFEITAKKIRG